MRKRTMKKIILSLLLLTSPLTVMAQAANIHVHGYVTALPCELEKANYLIDLKKVNVWNIRDTQTSPWVDFTIKLKNCPVDTQEAMMVINGTPDNVVTNYFINSGSAKNVALNLAYGENKITVKNGEKITAPVNTQTRTVEIPLSARMAGYGTGMTGGSFKSHLDFTLIYN
ncbi:fimbrial protein [Providencia alcalifaciens DSM 30120]|uniref:Fimbrial protein n=2 Tax=Providencia alcalifaciens TaxID=126385 RepID=B6XH55_9GAMM|nr:fimbrial protein [Providencia alcalifaciens DSM 30120]